MIVGTARSGTTLVQRLACELPGVHVPPETHLLSEFLVDLSRRGPAFPLEGPALHAVLERYVGRPYLREVPIEARAVAALLGNRCTSGIELFSAVVHHLGGGASILGEKTPEHLLWWEPLTRALPELRVVIVVRDPRGVNASFRAAGWGGPTALNAQRWKADARVARRALEALGDRALLVRYEDVVADPDMARERLRHHLGALPGVSSAEGPMFSGWESWKSATMEPITVARAERWREDLCERDQHITAVICRDGMRWLGYPSGRVTGRHALTTLGALPPRTQLSRLRRGTRRWRLERAVQRIGGGWR